MNIAIVPDVTTIDEADTAIQVALDRVQAAGDGYPDPAALTEVVDAYLVRSRLWLDLLPCCAGPRRWDLLRAVHAASTADRGHARTWRDLANRNAASKR